MLRDTRAKRCNRFGETADEVQFLIMRSRELSVTLLVLVAGGSWYARPSTPSHTAGTIAADYVGFCGFHDTATCASFAAYSRGNTTSICSTIKLGQCNADIKDNSYYALTAAWPEGYYAMGVYTDASCSIQITQSEAQPLYACFTILQETLAYLFVDPDPAYVASQTTTSPAADYSTSAPQYVYLCSFKQQNGMPPPAQCDFSSVVSCSYTLDSACVKIQSEYTPIYALISAVTSSNGSRTFSYPMYMDPQCTSRVFGVYVGVASMPLGECQPLLMAGQVASISFAFFDACPACYIPHQSITVCEYSNTTDDCSAVSTSCALQSLGSCFQLPNSETYVFIRRNDYGKFLIQTSDACFPLTRSPFPLPLSTCVSSNDATVGYSLMYILFSHAVLSLVLVLPVWCPGSGRSRHQRDEWQPMVFYYHLPRKRRCVSIPFQHGERQYRRLAHVAHSVRVTHRRTGHA